MPILRKQSSQFDRDEARTFFQRERAYWPVHAAGLAILILAMAAVGMAGLRPLAAAQREAAMLKSRLAAHGESLRTARQGLDQARARVDDLRRQLDDATLTLYDLSELNQRLADLTELARASQLVVHQVQPGEPVSGPHFERVAIQLAGEATYQTFTRFLSRMHREIADVEVRSLHLQSAAGEMGGPTPFRLECLWYARPRLERSAAVIFVDR